MSPSRPVVSRPAGALTLGLLLVLTPLGVLLPREAAPLPEERVSAATARLTAGGDLVRTLESTFPALKPRMNERAAFVAVRAQAAGSTIEGLRARRAPDAAVLSEAVGPLDVVFPRRASDAVVAEGEGVRVVLRPVGARSVPAEIVDGKLVYVGIHEDTDVLQVAGTSWTEEYLHLRSEDAPRRFEYELVETAGASSIRLANGEVQLFDEEGRGLLIRAPVVVDAAGRRSATAARWELRGKRLTLHLDPSGLRYPLVVDPSFTTGSMATARYDGIGILLQSGQVLVIAGAPVTQVTAELYNPATGAWSYTSPMTGPGRSAHAALLLRDGRVLVIGGTTLSGETDDCRLYDAVDDAWVAAQPLPAKRQHHTATLLTDGRVLVAGGADGATTPHTDAWLYDPLANSWTATGPMNVPRWRHGAALLQDGRVLVAGGLTTGAVDTNTAEIYDPGTGAWTAVENMAAPRQLFTLTTLRDGDVLAAGDQGLFFAERFRPGTGSWTTTGPLSQGRRYPTASLLPSGKVLLAGGHDGSSYVKTTEIFDPSTGQWSSGPDMQAARRRHSATMLPGGRVLIAGGQDPATLATAELIDLDVPAWSGGTPMTEARNELTLTVLYDGRVLAVGGVSSQTAEVRDLAGDWAPAANTLAYQRWRHSATLLHDGRVLLAGSIASTAAGRTAELFDPTTSTFALTGDMSVDRYWHTATLLPCGEVLVVGGRTVGSVIVASAERYNPLTGAWRPTGSLASGRWRHTATLLPDGTVLVTGGWGSSGTLDNAEVYDPVGETWTPVPNPMTVARYHHTATLLPSGRVLLVGGNGSQGSAELYDPLTQVFSIAKPLPANRQLGFTATLLPNGRVLVVGGFSSTRKADVYDPTLDEWVSVPVDLASDHDNHAAALLLDGRVLVAGGSSSAITETFDVGRGEQAVWRPVVTGSTDPLVEGSPLNVGGSGFQGLSEGSTGTGYAQSATNYPLVQLHRIDNDDVIWLPLGPGKEWSDATFDSLSVGGPRSGPVRVTVFTSGIPSLSKMIPLECVPPTVTSSPSDATVCEGGSAALSAAASGDCVVWRWRQGGTPLVEGGRFTGTRTGTLSLTGALPGDAGTYDAVAERACSSGFDVTASATVTVASDLSGVSAAPTSAVSVCPTCTGPAVSESHLDGGPVTHQWGYRTVPSGPVTPIPGRTAATYQVNGADFPGIGSYLLVVETTPACGPTLVSNEISVEVVSSPPGDDVQFFTITSRDSENVLEWVNPPGYDKVRIRYNTGSSCTFPVDPDLDGALLTDRTGPAGGRDRLPHSGLGNGTTYCYTLFVDLGGAWSAGRSNRGRPFDTSGAVKWAFSTGVLSMTAPTVGAAGVLATSNDNVVHAMKRDLDGGEWPAGWLPVALGGPVQSRSPIVPITVNGSNPVAYLGSQDGRVYVIDAAAGGTVPEPWSTLPVATAVQAAPAGIFTAFGGAFNYLLVGSRNPLGSNNSLIAMNPFTGGIITYFLNGGAAADRIGAINAMPAVDYANNRVYFTSVQDPSGAPYTLWALQLGSSPVFADAWSPQRDLGSLTSSPVLMGDRVYVGSLIGGGTIHSIDAMTGDAGLDRSITLNDGEIRGFPFPDRASNDIWFATALKVWGVNDDGSSLSVKHGGGFSLGAGVTPTSPVLFIPGDHYLYVGGSDGRLHELDTLTPAMNSVQLGDGQSAVGAPSLDRETGLIHVGTEAGVFYAVEFPLP